MSVNKVLCHIADQFIINKYDSMALRQRDRQVRYRKNI